jgi:hypothetical protein
MSIEAISWALNLAPIPTNRRDASSLAIVLVGLANHADPDGRNAFPAVATLVRYTRLSERSVRYALHALEELGLITPADPDIVAAYIKRADRRPNGWNLTLTAHPTPAPAPTTSGTSTTTNMAVHNLVHRVIHKRDDEVQSVHPAQAHGVQTPPNGVQTTTTRGAATAPEPSKNHPRNRPAHAPARAPGRDARPPALPGLCGQCDARPGDPASARIIWLDTDRQHSRACPRCHPSTAASHACRQHGTPRPTSHASAPAHATTHQQGLS